MVPEHLRYTKEHEWIRLEGNIATVGITAHAQSSLGDIVYCEFPRVGHMVKQFQAFGVVESVKAVSDLYAPVSGKVTEVNQTLIDNPALLNQDPYEQGWMVKIEMSAMNELDVLLDATAYQKII